MNYNDIENLKGDDTVYDYDPRNSSNLDGNGYVVLKSDSGAVGDDDKVDFALFGTISKDTTLNIGLLVGSYDGTADGENNS